MCLFLMRHDQSRSQYQNKFCTRREKKKRSGPAISNSEHQKKQKFKKFKDEETSDNNPISASPQEGNVDIKSLFTLRYVAQI